LQNLGHEIAMMIFDHAFASDDATRALALAKEMPKSWEPQLTAWFKQYTPILIVKSRDEVGLNAKFKAERKAEGGVGSDKSPVTYAKFWKRDEAEANPFFNFVEPEAETKPLDFAALVKLVQDLAKRIEGKVEKGEVKPDDVPSARAIAAQVKALNFKPVVVVDNTKPKAKRTRKPKVATPGPGNVAELIADNAMMLEGKKLAAVG
jgi:hypothetical protein